MAKYVKPIIIETEELAEGVYAASGATGGTPGCDSQYMNGVFAAPEWGEWGVKTMKVYYGCSGCRQYRDSGCGLQLDYVASGNAGSYEVDNGNRMPEWEKKGYTAETIVDATTFFN